MTAKPISKLFASLFLSAGLVGSASAFSLSGGDVLFSFDNYDYGVTYDIASSVFKTTVFGAQDVAGGYSATQWNAAYLNFYLNGGQVCNTAATCASFATDVASSSSTKVTDASGSGDTTWGIFQLSTVKIGGNTVYGVAAPDGFVYTGIYHGLTDYSVTWTGLFNGAHLDTLATGGTIEIYRNSLANSFDNAVALGTGGRSGSSFTGITDTGTLMLSADFSPSASLADPNATFFSNFTPLTPSGQSGAYLDVTGGAWAGNFIIGNSQDDWGNLHELYLDDNFNRLGLDGTITTGPDAGKGYCAAGNNECRNWSVVSTGKADAKLLPEPGTLALAGVGILGLALSRRRKNSV